MVDNHWLWRGKIILGLLLAASICGFFYFENSSILRAIVIIIGLTSLIWAVIPKTEKPPLASRREILILFTLYIGLYSLYNLLYSVSIPLYLVMIAVWALVTLLFLCLLILDRIDTLMINPLFWTFSCLIGLIILEIFLSLSFWPIDPKFKSLILVMIFYLVTNLIYLYTHGVLKFKRILGFLIVSILTIGLLILNIWLGLR